MRAHKTVIIMTIGFLVGIFMLLYPSFSDYWNSKTQSRAIVNYESVPEYIDPEDYTLLFEAAHRYNRDIAKLETLSENATKEMITSGFDLSLYTCTLGGNSRVTVRCSTVKKQ